MIEHAYDYDIPMPHLFGVFEDHQGGRKRIQILADLLREHTTISASLAEKNGVLYLPSKIATLRERGWKIDMIRPKRGSGEESTYKLIAEPEVETL